MPKDNNDLKNSSLLPHLSYLKYKMLRHFTLIELLIVISIIAILSAMLLPALNKARQKAYAVRCMSNIGQFSKAILMYASDHKEWIPPYRDASRHADSAFSFWAGSVEKQPNDPAGYFAPYIYKNTSGYIYDFGLITSNNQYMKFACPAQSQQTRGTSKYTLGTNNNTIKDSIGVFLPKLKTPSRNFLLMDALKIPIVDKSWISPRGDPEKKPNAVHSGGCNILMLDGHVESRKMSAIPTVYNYTESRYAGFWDY